MTRVVLVFAFILAASAALVAQSPRVRHAAETPLPPPFSIVEASIDEMRTALQQGRVTSRQLVEQSLQRIATYEETLNAVMTVNPRALAEADARDRERRAGKIRGPLHGIPIALKDNILTTDMPTTGGALAFDGLMPPYDATLVTNLREAGAIIVAKTVMTELANWIAGSPLSMPGNYSALGGYGRNPYDPRRDPREAMADGRPALSTGGSSSGIGTAASFWAANVGTETSGSILSPSNQTMLVGIKPTVGRISRYGIIPITADQDTAGPMARTVADAAILLGVLEGRAPDLNDAATNTCAPPPNRDYTAFLDRGALNGARIGIPRAYFYNETKMAGRERPSGGLSREAAALMDDVIAALKAEGAEIVDPADLPSVLEADPARNVVSWGVCSGADNAKGKDAACSVVFKYGMKRDFNAWLATLGAAAPVKSLTALRYWNLEHARANTIKYGQTNLDVSDEMDLVADRARYQADRAKDLALSATNGIDAVMKAQRLDALLFPGGSGASVAARAGYPTVIVPAGFVPNTSASAPFPAGFAPRPAPMGVSFTGMACSEPRLIALAYAFEQATRRRVPPVLDR
jgi:amidase